MSKAADVTDTLWESAVLQSETPVLVDFWAEWCGPCKAMSPYVDKLADETSGKLKVVKLNTQDNPEVPARYGITAILIVLVIAAFVVVPGLLAARGGTFGRVFRDFGTGRTEPTRKITAAKADPASAAAAPQDQPTAAAAETP